jgi:hypothetical protein
MGDIHLRPIGQRIDWLFDLAQRHGADYRSAGAVQARQRYHEDHPSAIVALKCMDGRVNIPVATQTPAGIVMPFRNLGGLFNLGWPHLGEVFQQHVQSMREQGRRVLVLITYHYAKGERLRGCAGFGFDQAASVANAWEIHAQVAQVFGPSSDSVYPLVCGFETDEEALILHPSADQPGLNLADWVGQDSQRLAAALQQLFVDMAPELLADLLPLAMGNLAHIDHIRQQNERQARVLDIEHHEWVICLGQGFDWLRMPNVALIIGPYSPNLADPIRTAADIIAANMQSGRVADDGFVLLASSPFNMPGPDRARAQLKAQFLAGFGARVIGEHCPALAKRMHIKTAVLDWEARRLHTG